MGPGNPGNFDNLGWAGFAGTGGIGFYLLSRALQNDEDADLAEKLR